MQFGLLGHLRVQQDGMDLQIRAGRHRSLLAALLMRPNQVVSVDSLAAAVWDDAQTPADARAALRNYVARLRRLLGPEAGRRIVTWSPGYMIELAADELDVTRFTALCRRARSTESQRRPLQAALTLREALGLWRGCALADIPSRRYHQDEVDRLEEARLQALEWRIDADLELGRHQEVVGELRGLAAAHPTREPFHRQLMLALHRSGFQAEALEAYLTARRQLIHELGVEPGPDLRELHRRILLAEERTPAVAATVAGAGAVTGDWDPNPAASSSVGGIGSGPGAGPGSGAGAGSVSASGPLFAPGLVPGPVSGHLPALEPGLVPGFVAGSAPGIIPGPVPAPAPVPISVPGPVPGSGPGPGYGAGFGAGFGTASLPMPGADAPAEVPAAPRDFTGRGPQLDALRAALTPAHGASEIATVTGAGGIGKTALMLQAAQQIRAAYPDGQLFADLRGSGNRPAHPADVLTRFLLSLGLRPDAVVADADGLAAQYRTLLADRRVLVVLDDARDADQVRPLLPGAGASGVLVSSRSRLAALEGAHRLSLGPMPQPEAAALFRRIAPPLRAEARLSLPRVLDVCAGLPLAVRIAASRLTADPLLDLRELAHQLSDPARVLDALRLGDLDLRTVLDSCYGALPAASCPNGQGLAPAEALCALGLLPADPEEGGAQAERPVDLAGVAGLVDRPAAAVRRALGVLADVGLLEFRPPDRYLLRPLVAAYARERAIRELAPEEREAALIRLLDRPRHRRHAALRG